MGRNNAARAEERLEQLREYSVALMKLDTKYISSEIMTDFFSVNDDDMKLMKEKNE